MTAVTADFNYILVYRIFTVVAAIFFAVSDIAVAQLMSAFIFIFHKRKSSLDFLIFVLSGNKIILSQLAKLGNDLPNANRYISTLEKSQFLCKK